jgi:hypothetical protein
MNKTLIAVSDCPSGRYIPDTRIIVDGREVSDCTRAVIYSDGTGAVTVLKRNEQGQLYTEDGVNPAVETISGSVEIIPPDVVPPESWAQMQAQWLQAERDAPILAIVKAVLRHCNFDESADVECDRDAAIAAVRELLK